jgi:RND superfamily putative drug exporter
MNTAGRAVLFAGVTVMIALLGMLVLGVTLLDATAVAAALAVVLTMSAALTILPVLLRRFGDRVARPAPKRRSAGRELWPRWAELVSRHPWTALVSGLAIMLVLALPALSLRLGQSDAGNDPTSLTSRRAYDILAHEFGAGFNGPLQIVAQLRAGGGAGPLTRIGAALRTTPGILPAHGPRIAGDDRPRQPAAGRPPAPGRARDGRPPARRRSDRHRHRLRARARPQARAVRRRRGRVGRPVAPGGVPVDRDPDPGRGDEPAVGGRVAGRRRRGVPVRLARRPLQRTRRAD